MTEEREFLVTLEVRLRLARPFAMNADAGYFAHTAASRCEGLVANGVTVMSVEPVDDEPRTFSSKINGAPLSDDTLHTH